MLFAFTHNSLGTLTAQCNLLIGRSLGLGMILSFNNETKITLVIMADQMNRVGESLHQQRVFLSNISFSSMGDMNKSQVLGNTRVTPHLTLQPTPSTRLRN